MYISNSGHLPSGNFSTDGQRSQAWDDMALEYINDAVENESAIQGGLFSDNTTDNINFNPVVDFGNNNNTYGYTLGDNFPFSTNNGLTMIAVAAPESSGDHRNIISFGGYDTTAFGLSHGMSKSGAYTPTNHGGTSTFTKTHTYGSKPTIITNIIDFNSASELYHNGEQTGSNTPITLSQLTSNEISASEFRSAGSSPLTIGVQGSTDNQSGRNFAGNISEIIIYDEDISEISPSAKLQIESYLALKYGITLDQTISQPYISSSVTDTIWKNDGDGYQLDIFGIGRDIEAGLDQKVSKSVNDNTILTLALDADFTSSNKDAGRTTQHTNDLQFLTFANNGGSTTGQTTELDESKFYNRIGKEWKADMTANFTQPVNLKFEGFDSTYVLVKDADGDFSTGSTAVAQLNANGEALNVSINHGNVYTLMQTMNPGGVSNNLAFWFRADLGGVDWEDLSTSNTTLTKNGNPTLSTKMTNYNPQIAFHGNSSYSLSNANFANGNSNRATYVVATQGNPTLNGVRYMFSYGVGNNSQSSNMGRLGERHFISGHGLNFVPTNKIWKMNETDLVVHIEDGSSPTTGILRNNGETQAINSDAYDNQISQGNTGYIGAFDGGSDNWDADISEIIAFNTSTESGSERHQIESYLALKYRISLFQGTPYHYIASSVTDTIWKNDGDGYSNNIFGIGRDDLTGLNQNISKSQNTEAIIIASLEANYDSSTVSPSRTLEFNNDLEFISFADNGGTLNWQTTELCPCKEHYRLNREWKVDKTTNAQDSVYLAFSKNDLSTIPSNADVYLVIDKDGDFSQMEYQAYKMELNASNYYSIKIPIEHNDYFTIAYVSKTGILKHG